MICSAENKQFIDKILGMKVKDIKQMLKEEDEKYIVRKKRQIIQNMPEDLKPNENIETKATSLLKNIFQVNFTNQKLASEAKLSQFPSTFNEKTKSHHWDMKAKQSENQFGLSGSKGFMQNLMSNFEGFKSGFEGEAILWKGERLPDVDLEMNEGERKEMAEELRLESEIKEIGQEDEGREIQKQVQQKPSESGREGDNQSEVTFTQQVNNVHQNQVPNPFAPLLFQQKHSPFISNKANFLDPHTNKKPLNPTYLTPETYAMNMLQYAHNQKRENTFQDGYSYPNVIMSGMRTGWMKAAQGMRENPFRGTFVAGPRYGSNQQQGLNEHSLVGNETKLNVRNESESKFRENVQDVLKYTLGDKRYTNSVAEKELARSINLKSSMLESSFQKQPHSKKQRVLENPFARRPSSTFKY